MKKEKNNLDEMQEQKLLKIEHNAAWLAFWGLFLAIFIQLVIGGENLFRNLIGEWIVFMCLCIYILAGCIKNGIWDRRLKPTPITNGVVSAVASLISSIVFFVSSYIKYHKLLGSIATGVFIFVGMFALCFAALSFFSSVYKNRIKKLDQEEEE